MCLLIGVKENNTEKREGIRDFEEQQNKFNKLIFSI